MSSFCVCSNLWTGVANITSAEVRVIYEGQAGHFGARLIRGCAGDWLNVAGEWCSQSLVSGVSQSVTLSLTLSLTHTTQSESHTTVRSLTLS